MGNIQIPNLPPAIALDGTEQLEIVQTGVSRRATSRQIAAVYAPETGQPYTATFQSRADFIATSLPSNIIHVVIADGRSGIAFDKVPGGPIAQSDGTTWAPSGTVYPEHYGALGNNIANDAPAITAALNSGAKLVRGYDGSTYYIAETVAVSGLSDVTFDLGNASIRQGVNATPGIYFGIGCVNCHFIDGTVIGNYPQAGPYNGLFTTGGITDGDTVGVSASWYVAVSTITIDNLGTGWLVIGDRISYISGGTVYGYIVQSNVQIVGGSATVDLDRILDVPLSAGQTIWVDQGDRRFAAQSAYSSGVSTITVGAASVTSPSGTPEFLPGDQFCFYFNSNDVDSIDYTTIYTVVSATPFAGSYPSVTSDVTFTPALASPVPKGTRITSIQDYRNNKFSLVLFYGTENCSASNVSVVDAQLHGIAFNSTIRAPWDGTDPSIVRNMNPTIINCTDKDGQQGSAFVSAHSEKALIANNTAEGSTIRNAVQLEQVAGASIVQNRATGMKTGVMVTGETEDAAIVANVVKGCQIGIEQRNICRNISIIGNAVENDPLFSLCGIKVEAGLRDESLAEETFNSLSVVQGNNIRGRCLVTGSYNGSSILVQPPTATATASDSLRPHYVSVVDNVISYAGRHGIEVLQGVRGRVEGNTVFHAGYRGISIISAEDVDVVGNTVVDAGETVPSPAFYVDGGIGIIFTRNKADTDASTGQTWGVELANTPLFRRYDANVTRGSVPSNRVSTTDPVSFAALGYRSLESVETGGVRNSAIGALSGRQITSGDNNTAIGYGSGQTVTTGNRNTFLGAGADSDIGSRNNGIAIGWGAVVRANGEIAIGDDTGVNGVSTTTSATAGAASVLPAQPLGYLVVRINGVASRIPYYSV